MKNHVIKVIICIFAGFALCLSVCATEIGSDDFFSERDLIARVLELTIPNGSYAAKLALGAVIVNRVNDARFPSNVRSVIYQEGEFLCVYQKDFEKASISYLSKVAARDALLGFDVTAGALYYKKGGMSESEGACFHHSGFLFFRDAPQIKKQ